MTRFTDPDLVARVLSMRREALPDRKRDPTGRKGITRYRNKREIAADCDVSLKVVTRILRESGEPARLRSDGIKLIGDRALQWAEGNESAVQDLRSRIREAGLPDPGHHTIVALLAAERMTDELVAQTGGARPTIRTVVYRMMGVIGFEKTVYATLITASATLRTGGVWARDYFAEDDPLAVYAPNDWTPGEALTWALSHALPYPWDAFADTPLVIGVLIEPSGSRAAIEGALDRRLGFRVPVFDSGGMGRISRLYAIEQRMRRWARQDGQKRAPVLFPVTDHDPSGYVIAHGYGRHIGREETGIEVVRLGMTAALADEHGAPGSEGIAKDDADMRSHEKTQVWREAVEADGGRDRRFQAEALDYATWARIIGDAVEQRLAEHDLTVKGLRDALRERGNRSRFKRARELMKELREWAEFYEDAEVYDDPAGMIADGLGIVLDEPLRDDEPDAIDEDDEEADE